MVKQFQQVGKTPLKISAYSVKSAPTQLHKEGVLEIIFCLKGSVRFSYAYEEFTLNEGEYISVDKDAYYLYDGRDNLCVSFYIDLLAYEKKYPFIRSALFVCEALAESTMPYPTKNHTQLKGMLISLLRHIREGGSEEKVAELTQRIVDLFVYRFDISFFHTGAMELGSKDLERLHQIQHYMYTHLKEKITLQDLARHFGMTEGYVSEYIRKMSIGFRSMLSYVRANRSEAYLLETDKTIVEISEECGFSDVKYYYAAFKRWYKCTPRQFRQRYGKEGLQEIQYFPIDSVDEILDRTLIKHYMNIFLGYEALQ